LKICVAQPAFLSSGADGRGTRIEEKRERGRKRVGDGKEKKRGRIVCERRSM